jgi:hypothetical protein
LTFITNFFSGADFVFNIHAAQTASPDRGLSEQLQISQTCADDDPDRPVDLRPLSAPDRQRRPAACRLWRNVDIDHHIGNPDSIKETPDRQLPLSALTYIYPAAIASQTASACSP